MSDKQWDDFIKEVDQNDNGTVSWYALSNEFLLKIEFDEFKVMMRNLTNKAYNSNANSGIDSRRPDAAA